MLCPECGTLNLDTSRFCSSCGAALKRTPLPDDSSLQAPSDRPPAQSPQIPSPEQPVSEAQGPPSAVLPIARMWDRVLALILDSILIGVAFFVSGMWSAVKWGGVTANGFSLTGMPALIAIFATTLFAFLYYWLMEGLFGATLGKLILGIRVTDVTGQRCGMKGSLIRNLLRIVDGLLFYLVGFVVALCSRRRQRIGDHAAKTVVVKKGAGKALRIFIALLWLLLAGGGAVFAWFLHRNAPPFSRFAGEGPRVARFEFLDTRDGAPRVSNIYRPGDKLFTRYTISGYETDEQGRANLAITITVTDPNQLTVAQWQGNLNRTLGKEESAMGTFNFTLVPFAPPGIYRIRTAIRDEARNKSAEQVTNFVVDAPQPVYSNSLDLRDMQLSLSDGGPPITGTVSPGSTVHLNAKLAGMRFAGDRIQVRVAFQLVDPQGEVIIDKPDFIVVDDTFAYHPPGFYLPISSTVTLPAGGPVGTYTQKYQVTDLVANASAAFSQKVDVE